MYFCAREGEFLKEEFDDLSIKYNRAKCTVSHYLLVSRKSTFLPSLNPDINKEEFLALKISSPDICINDFLSILGMKLEDFSGYKDVDCERIIPDFFSSTEFQHIKKDSRFSKLYKESVLKEKIKFKSYLSSIGITDDTNQVYIVDIGWRGTIQDNLHSFFGNGVSITGLYYGIQNTSDLSFHNRKIGLVYSDVPYKSYCFDVFATNHRMLERILQASHGSADHYEDGKCILSEFSSQESNLYKLMQSKKKDIKSSIDAIYDCLSLIMMSNFEKEKIIAMFHEAYLLLFSRELCRQENDTSGLMSLTFGTGRVKNSYKSLIRKFYRLPSVEKKNKALKALRKIHFGIIADFIGFVHYREYKRKILRMAI